MSYSVIFYPTSQMMLDVATQTDLQVGLCLAGRFRKRIPLILFHQVLPADGCLDIGGFSWIIITTTHQQICIYI